MKKIQTMKLAALVALAGAACGTHSEAQAAKTRMA
jgi:hypothetical protein